MSLKRKLLTLLCIFTVILTFYISPFCVYASQQVYVAGIPAGFTIKTDGVEVIGLSEIITEEGKFSPSKASDIRIGDIITKIGNEEIFDGVAWRAVIFIGNLLLWWV